MQDEWLIDVMTDLKKYAQSKGLTRTEAHLADTCLVAMAEIAEHSGLIGVSQTAQYEIGFGTPHRVAPESDIA